MCHKFCHYYTELDCVCMYGTLNPCSDMKLILRQAPSFDVKDCSDADEIVSLTMAYMNTLSVSSPSDEEDQDLHSIDENKDPRQFSGEVIQRMQGEVTDTELMEGIRDGDGELGNGYFDNLPVRLFVMASCVLISIV